MTALRRLLRDALKRTSDWFARWIVNRELRFIAIILTTYIASILCFQFLSHLNILTEITFVSFTIASSCTAFLLGQIAFLSRAKSIERNLQLKNTLSSLMDEIYVKDKCFISYINIGDQKAKIIQESKQEEETAKQVILDLSLLAIETCNGELINMLKKKRIQRSGNEAYLLTQECYQFAKRAVKAVAPVSDTSLDFWSQADGIGQFFYKCNREALRRDVEISRYFVFAASDIERLQTTESYKNAVLDAVTKYIEELPLSILFFAYQDERWHSFYPDTHSGDEQRVKSNRKFREYYLNSFPDVSLFDDSVASLWRGASSDRINEVRISWESMHVACVRDIFGKVLSNKKTKFVQRNENQGAGELLAAFLQALEHQTTTLEPFTTGGEKSRGGDHLSDPSQRPARPA